MSTCRPNVFCEDFLEALPDHFDYPVLFRDGDTAGPWNVIREKQDIGSDWLLKMASDPEPFGSFKYHEAAFMLAAVMPAAGRSPFFEVEGDGKDWRLSMPLSKRGALELGTVTDPDDFLVPLHTAQSLLLSPDSLAWLLMAAQPDTLERAGALVIRRLRELSAR